MKISMRLKVFHKLLFGFFLAGLIPALTMYFISSHGVDTMSNKLGDSFAGHAAIILETIDRNLSERYGDVQAFALNEATQDSME